jgi:mannose-6-phosphate isomerase-like protein (cupin superfamily)
MEIIKKPWGQEEILEINEKYMMKRLTMKKGHRCSLQYHNKKKETILVISGILKIVFGKDKNNLQEKLFKPGESFTLNPGIVHRMEGVEESIYIEASTPEMEDVVRLVDDYNR